MQQFRASVRSSAWVAGAPMAALGIAVLAAACTQGPKSIDEEHRLQTNGRVTEFPLPDERSSPSTIALAPDGSIWFTLSGVNAIARMNADGSAYRQFPLPTPDSSPRIIALGADGNMWFSEHAGNKIGRITPQGEITEFAIPTPASQPRAIALGADGNIWIGLFAAGKIGRITPSGEMTEFDIPTPDSGPRALAPSIW